MGEVWGVFLSLISDPTSMFVVTALYSISFCIGPDYHWIQPQYIQLIQIRFLPTAFIATYLSIVLHDMNNKVMRSIAFSESSYCSGTLEPATLWTWSSSRIWCHPRRLIFWHSSRFSQQRLLALLYLYATYLYHSTALKTTYVITEVNHIVWTCSLSCHITNTGACTWKSCQWNIQQQKI